MRKIFHLLFFIFCICFFQKAKTQNWVSLDSGMNWFVWTLYADTLDTFLYAGGGFSVAGNVPANRIARWNGTQWDSMGNGSMTSPLRSITRYNAQIYTAGKFFANANHIAKWNGITWDSVAQVQGSVVQFLIDTTTNTLYTCGTLTNVDGIALDRIAKYNGTNWSAIDTTVWDVNSGWAMSMAIYNGELYMGGNFWSPGPYPQTILRIAKWNGTIWVPVGGGIKGLSAVIYDMIIYNNELYVAGGFSISNGNAGNNIMKWNGTTWSDVGGGITGFGSKVYNLEVHNGKLYAVGLFNYAGGVPANNIAVWDGTNWCGLGSVVDNSGVHSITFYKDTLYIGGDFWTIDGDSMNYISKWAGGNFTDTCGNTSGINENNFSSQINVYPNPSTGIFTLQSPEKISEIEIVNVLGEKVYEMDNGKLSIVNYQFPMDLSSQPDGVYFVKMNTDKGIVSRKVVLMR